MCLRRANLVLDERLLEEATRALGAKTDSAAVNTALAEVIRLEKDPDPAMVLRQRNLGGGPARYARRPAASKIPAIAA